MRFHLNTIKKIVLFNIFVLFFQPLSSAQTTAHTDKSTTAQHAPALIRVDKNGVPDRSFNGGKGVFAYVKDDLNIAIIADLYKDYKNRIITIGNRHFTYARFNLDGKLDLGFNMQGLQRIKPINEGIENSSGISVRRTHNLTHTVLSAGNGFFKDKNSTNTRPLIVRLNENGSLDHTFGEEGVIDVTTALNIENQSLEISTVDIMDISRERYILLGTVNQYTDNSHLILTSFKKNGHIDTAFGSECYFISRVNEKITGKQLLEYQGFIYVVAESTNLTSKKNFILICRFDQITGEMDKSFGKEGFITTKFNSGNIKVINAGSYGDRLVVVGRVGQRLAIARYNLSQGELDIEFSGDGKRVISLDNYSLYPADITMNYENKVYICGTAYSKVGNTRASMFLLILSPEGEYDPNFSIHLYNNFTTQNGETEPKLINYSGNKMFLEKSGYILIGGSMNYDR